MTELVQSSSQESKCKITVATLKSIAAEQSVSTRGGTVMLKSGSKVLPVQIGNRKVLPVEAKFSHENLMKLQSALNLSDISLKYVYLVRV